MTDATAEAVPLAAGAFAVGTEALADIDAAMLAEGPVPFAATSVGVAPPGVVLGAVESEAARTMR